MNERTATPDERRSTHEQAGQRDPAIEQQHQGREDSPMSDTEVSTQEGPDQERRGDHPGTTEEGADDPDDRAYRDWDKR